MKTEKQTRKEIIDKKLNRAGWDLNDRTQVVLEYDIPVDLPDGVREPVTSYQGHQFSDYVLLGRDAKPLAVIEAKKTSKDPAIGREQAKQYCINVQAQTKGDLPFCFFTNGHETYFWDLGVYPPQKVFGFPTRDDLERYLYLRKNRKPLATELINPQIAGRDYQIHAIRSVMESVAEKHRKFLLVMATGTGKTRVSIALIDALMRAGWAERALFLVDRIALREQALDAFKVHLPNEPRWPNPGEKSIVSGRRIYVSTYPTMLNIVRSEENPLSSHFFDLIIIDESHRSIYNTYQEILDYFHAVHVGLTATPTDIIDHNTFDLFQCKPGVPTYAFSYEEAVRHHPPYLCEFQVLKIKTRFQDEGISKRTISLEDQKQLLLEGRDIEEINYEGTDIEKKVINKGTNALIVKAFMEEGIKDPNGVLPGKTIFFCISIAHARRIEQLFDALYPQYHGELAKVIVSDDPRVYGKSGLLHQFTHQDMPRVAISVDMLDTGIDVREAVNLVFAKPVYSYTKFWQMVGRGTRLLDEIQIKPWCPQKDAFLIMDCWDNFDYFRITPKGKEVKPQIPLPVRLVAVRITKIEKAWILGINDIINKETQRLRTEIMELPQNAVVIQQAQADLDIVADDNYWTRLTPEKFTFLRSCIQPLFRAISLKDFKAMRFEKDVLETSLAHLAQEPKKFDALMENLIEQIGELPLTVNIVAREADFIREAQTNHFWATITETRFDQLIQRLSPLMKFRETTLGGSIPASFNFTDSLKTKEVVEFGPQHEAVGITQYKAMVEQRVHDLLKQNPIMQKLHQGLPLDMDEADRLAETLHQEHPYITLDLLRRIYQNKKAHFEQFIRHILGMQLLESFSETVTNAVDQFIRTHTDLSTRQLEFLNLLRDFLVEREFIEKRDLIQAPFTLIHPNGIRGVFSPREIQEILTLTEQLVA